MNIMIILLSIRIHSNIADRYLQTIMFRERENKIYLNEKKYILKIDAFL